MAWLYLILAGGLEVFWATFLKLSHGFTVFKFTAITVVGMVLSFFFLAQATKVLPIGTSYAIWTGIGAFGAVIVGMILFREPMSLLRGFFVLLLIAGMIGIKLTSAH